MGLDIGQALREGASRTATRDGLVLAAVFGGIALLTVLLWNTLFLRFAEFGLELIQAASPEEMGLSQAEYEEQLEAARDVESFLRDSTTVGVSMSVAAIGVLVTAIFAEAVSIIAVRVFAADGTESISSEFLTDNILLATLNGFVGGLVVWSLILFGTVLLIVPGIVLAVLFYFVRQEIAVKNKNFIQAMADSWRLTKGNRIEVFLVGATLVIVSQLEPVTSTAVGVLSEPVGIVAGALVGGLLAAFGAAVATRAYVQIVDEAPDGVEANDEPVDPYDAALGPDDLPR